MFVLFWNWPRTLISLGNNHLIFFFDYIEINMTIIKNMSKSFYDWSVFFSWNLRNTKICYRNSGMTNIKLKMFHTRYFIISVEWKNFDVRKCKERGRRKIVSIHPPPLYTLVYGVTVLRSNGKTYQSCSRHQSTSSWRRSGVQFLKSVIYMIFRSFY